MLRDCFSWPGTAIDSPATRDLQLGAVIPAGAAACQEREDTGKAGLLAGHHCYRCVVEASSSTGGKKKNKPKRPKPNQPTSEEPEVKTLTQRRESSYPTLGHNIPFLEEPGLVPALCIAVKLRWWEAGPPHLPPAGDST